MREGWCACVCGWRVVHRADVYGRKRGAGGERWQFECKHTLPMEMVARSNQRNAFYYIIFGRCVCVCVCGYVFDGFRVLNLIFN